VNRGPYESLITWFARNSVAANLLMVILLLWRHFARTDSKVDAIGVRAG